MKNTNTNNEKNSSINDLIDENSGENANFCDDCDKNNRLIDEKEARSAEKVEIEAEKAAKTALFNAKKAESERLAEIKKSERAEQKREQNEQKNLEKTRKKAEKTAQKREKTLKKREKIAQKLQKIAEKRENNELKRQKKLQKKQGFIFAKQQKITERENSLPYQIKKIAKAQPTHKNEWFKLDNAALIYPALARDSNAQFRLAAVLNEEIDPILLQRALNQVVSRYPTITSSLKAGLFWWYLDAPTTPLVIEEQTSLPCRPLRLDHRRSMIRITYFHKEIAIEFFHSATDGTGGLNFLNSLIAAYLELGGAKIIDRTNCPNPKDKPRFEEMRDCFQAVKNKEKLPPPEHVKAMHMKGKPLPQNGLVYYKLVCDADTLKTASKNLNASVTQFLTAAVLQAIHEQQADTLNKDKRPIRISIPINLRNIYGMETFRNFSSYFYAEYTGGTFGELIESVKQQFTDKVTHDYVQSNINYNTSSQSSPLIRVVPLCLKYLVLKGVYHNLGYRQNSASLSNLGVVKAPKEFAEHIVRYEFSFGRTFCEPVGITTATYNGITTIICNSVIADTQFERHLVKCLVDNGVEIVLESNEGVKEKNETL